MDDVENQPQPSGGVDTGQGTPSQTPPETQPSPGAGAAPVEPALAPTPPPMPESQPAAEPSPAPAEPSGEAEAPVETSPVPEETSPIPQVRFRLGMPEIPHARLIIAAIGIVVMLGVVFIVTQNLKPPVTTTTTTVSQLNVENVKGCGVISKPGTYLLVNNINTSQITGACITITSSNVKFLGNQNIITGSGPYSGVPPFSYGILLLNVSNVTVSGVKILRFSYDIFMNKTEHSVISDSNLTRGTLSGLYLYNSGNNTIQNNKLSLSESVEGSVYLRSGGNNRLLNNTMYNNVYYGLVINTTDNKLAFNHFYNNPVDLICNATSGFRYTNTFRNSTCYTNDYCEFASCAKNVPFNLSALRLAPGPVQSCGAILTPGNYTLARDLSTSAYINASNPVSRGTACIRVVAPNVNLNCGNNKISNSGTGLSLYSAFNTNVSSCAFTNDSYGVYVNNSFNARLKNVSVSRSWYGIYLNNLTTGRVSGVNLTNNTYGLYVGNSTGVLFDQISSRGGTYGVYTAGGGSDIFNGGTVTNNTKADFYCAPSTYNSMTNLAQNIACGTTDCSWAQCKQIIPAQLASYPISSCKNIVFPGNYSLTRNVIASSSCFGIQANNVRFNCKGHAISGPAFGAAFIASGQKNVSVSNCKITQFDTAFNVSNSRQVTIAGSAVNNTPKGVHFQNVSNSSVTHTNVSIYTNYGFFFNRTSGMLIDSNKALSGARGASGFIFTNGAGDRISFNNATSNPNYGFQFTNMRGNRIYNNSAYLNNNLDYYCSPEMSGLYVEPTAVNFGLSKNRCNWLVEIDPLVPGIACGPITVTQQVTFTRDMLYTTGATCFSIYNRPASTLFPATSANGTSINCNGHTIYATHGGTFMRIVNSSSVSLQNCVIQNFTTALNVTAPRVTLQNNTIAQTGTSIILSGAGYASVSKNFIENGTNGVIARNAGYTNILQNTLYNVTNAIKAYNITSSNIQNNTALRGLIGLSLNNTTLTSVWQNLLLNMSSAGLICSGSSVNKSSSNLDQGGNVCTNNVNCKWMTYSTGCHA